MERILVCLEITKDVVAEAISKDIDLIITHHPLLFSGIKCIDRRQPLGEYLIELIFTGISVYSAHTNFDAADGGNNDDLAQRLGLTQVQGLFGSGEYCIGRVGMLPQPMTLAELASRTDAALRHPGGLRAVGDSQQMVQRVGLCTGAGAEFIPAAQAQGCDVYLSGDIKYHEAQQAKESGMCIIDAGHFGTEWIFVENMAQQLRRRIGGQAKVIESSVNVNPYSFTL